jgi:hypothetical protein
MAPRPIASPFSALASYPAYVVSRPVLASGHRVWHFLRSAPRAEALTRPDRKVGSEATPTKGLLSRKTEVHLL